MISKLNIHVKRMLYGLAVVTVGFTFVVLLAYTLAEYPMVTLPLSLLVLSYLVGLKGGHYT
jgi:hypothetical protein